MKEFNDTSSLNNLDVIYIIFVADCQKPFQIITISFYWVLDVYRTVTNLVSATNVTDTKKSKTHKNLMSYIESHVTIAITITLTSQRNT